MNVDVATDDFGGKANVTVTVNTNATGKVNITVNGTTYEVAIVDGKAVLNLTGLAPGKYTVTVSYDGDGNFTAATATAGFTIATVDPSLGVVVGNITYGNNATIVVNVNPGATGKVNITVNGKSELVDIVNGRATLIVSGLAAGNYTVSVKYDGDGKFNGDNVSAEFTVSAIDPGMNVVVSNITYGNNVTVTVTVNDKATGKVNITVNGVDYEVDIVDGRAVYTVVNPTAGKYTVTVSYNGDGNFTAATASTEFNVTKINPDMTVTVSNITYGNNATVTVNVNNKVTGKVNVTVNGATYEVDIVNGKGTLVVSGLAAGSYTVTVSYDGDGNFTAATATADFNVAKISPDMNVDVSTFDYGTKANVTVTVNDKATGSVTISIDGGAAQTVAIVNGKATYTFTGITNGTHTVTVNYAGDVNFTADSKSIEFIAGNGDASLSVIVGNITYGNNATIVVTTTSTATGTVDITVNGKTETLTLVNGKATLNVAGLAAGNYTVTVTYSGDANFTGSTVSTDFNVAKISAGMNVGVGNITYGANGTVTVTVNPEATGKVNIAINGTTHEVAIVDGKATLVVSGLAAGKYSVTVSYNGDGNFTAANAVAEFTVSAIDPSINVGVGNTTYGNNVTVTVTVNNKATGKVNITVNGTSHIVDIVNGKATLVLSGLGAADYTVTVSYAGDGNFTAATASAVFNVAKISADMTVAVDNITYGNDATVFVTMDARGNGTVTITVNGQTYTQTIKNGIVILPISGLGAGVYKVTVSYDGDGNFTAASAETEFTVSAINPGMNVGVGNITYGANATVTVTANDKLTGKVNVTVNGITHEVDVVNGKGTLVVSGLNAGSYTVTVSYAGNDNFTAATANADFIVAQITPDVTVDVANITYGANATVTVTVSNKVTGKVNVTVNGATYEVDVVNGKGTLVVSGLAAGSYTVSVKYAGDINFAGVNASSAFTVSKAAPGMNVGVVTSDYGTKANVTVTVNDKATGSVSISIDGGAAQTVAIVNGKATYEFTGLTNGTHTIAVSYAGDNNFTGDSKSVEFSAGSGDAGLTVTVGNITYGNNATIVVSVNPSATGNVTINVNGKDYIETLVNGKATLTVAGLAAGNYTVKVSYSGDANFTGSNKNTTFTVSKINAGVNVIVSNITYGDNETVIVTVNPEATGTVTITVNGRTETATLVDGKATFTVSGLNAGNYTVIVKYSGDSNFANSTVNADFVVAKISPNMTVNVTTVDNGGRATATVTVNTKATGTVTISIGGSDYIVPIANGRASFTVYDLAVGNHTVTVRYDGDVNFIGQNVTTEFAINAVDPGLNVVVGNISYGNNATIVVTINPTTTGTVSITVNGRTETVTPVNGVATLNVAGLAPGKYTVTVKYDGDAKFANATVSANFTVSKLDAGMNVIVGNISYGANATVTVTVNSQATGKVNITINGVTHEVAIVDGKATYVLVNPNAGNYDVTVSYAGDSNFANATINTGFIVSKISPNMTVDIATVDKGGKATVTVTVNTKATGTITINIGGTDHIIGIINGKAIVSVSDLVAGNYTVDVKYAGDVNFIGANVTTNFTIGLVDPSLGIVVGNITYGNDATIIVTVDPAVTGKVNITVNGASHMVDIVNGRATLTVSGLAAGSYPVTVSYDGNAVFANATVNAEFIVSKINPGISVNVGNTTYGNNATVFVTMDARGNGTVNITVNGKTYTQTIKDGKVILPISGLGAGVYKVTVSYDGDGNFTAAIAEAEFTVSAINPGMTVNVGNITYGANATVTVNVNPAATGRVNITVNGASHMVDIVNGKATLVLSGLAAGSYTVTVSYNGDSNFTATTVTADFVVAKINPGMNVDVATDDFGSKANVTVTVNTEATGKVNITVNGTTHEVDIVNGKATLVLSDLAPGKYTVTVSYDGDGNFTGATENTEFTIGVVDPSLSVTVGNITYGNNATIVVNVNPSATGKVNITVNGATHEVDIVNGKAK